MGGIVSCEPSRTLADIPQPVFGLFGRNVIPAAEAPAKKKARAKAPAAPRVRTARAKKVPRMRARWGVFDGGMKQVAVFDYDQRTAAEEKVVALLSRNKGPYFLQIVKEAMPESAPVPGVPDE